jgi:hypothetical protein
MFEIVYLTTRLLISEPADFYFQLRPGENITVGWNSDSGTAERQCLENVGNENDGVAWGKQFKVGKNIKPCQNYPVS